MKAKILTLGMAFGLAGFAHGAGYAPVPLTANSFQFHNVIPSNQPPVPYYQVTFTIDNGVFPTGGNGNTPMEIGADANGGVNATYGIPHSGTTWTSQAPGQSGHHYTMPVFYPGSNVLAIASDAPHTTGNLVINDPTDYTGLSFVTCGGGSGTIMNLSVQHADGVNEAFNNINTDDWFNGTSPGPNILTVSGVSTTNYWVWKPTGRAAPGGTSGTANFNNMGTVTGSKLYSWDILLSDTTSPVTNVNVTFVGGGRVMFHCVSGTTDGVNYNAVASLSGFNEKGIVLTVLPLPYNATMDNGTNIAVGGAGANTWYEKGWYPGATNTGFPYHGSTLVSAATGRPYQMPPDYTVAMCALIDTNHQTLNITPASPSSYTAFSLLVTGGSEGNPNVMSNILIMQHDDGSQETNIFNCYDWFDSSHPVAYNAQGRASFNSGSSVNSVNGGNPKLFESQFVLQNSRSPVTNILIQYYNPGLTNGVFNSNNLYKVNWTTYIFAVSATAGGIPLILNTNTLAQNVYAGGTASFVVNLTTGVDRNSVPHYQWQYSAAEYGPYSNLTDGVNGVAGSTTTNLTVTGVTGGSVGFYQCVATNTVSTNITMGAPLTLLVSTAANVSQPGDLIADFGSTSADPGGQGATNVFDGSLAKWLNYGNNVTNPTGPPFMGPVGYVTSPQIGSTIVNALRFIVASDVPGRDPVDYLLEGSNDGTNYTLISSNYLALADVRNLNLTNAVELSSQVLQEVDFANANSYFTYRVTFQNVKTNAIVNSLQLSEVQMLGTLANTGPGLSAQPSGTQTFYNNAGQNFAGASVTAYGISPFTYQWYQGVNPLAGQTTATLSGITNVQVSNAGNYYCVVSNAYGFTNSSAVTLNVLTVPPVFLTQPSGTNTLYADSGLTFAGASVTVTSTPPFTYQWYQGATALPGQTTATLSPITNVQVANSGNYYCMVSNPYGSTNSTAVTLVVVAQPPIILSQPSGNKSMYVGGTLTASVTVTGSSPFFYHWYNGAAALPGQTTANLSYHTTSLSDAGAYSCTISNEFGATNSTAINLSLITPPTNAYVQTIAASGPVAWWRLDEPDNGLGNTGTVATDYYGGHDGIYTNVVLGITPGYSIFDPDTAAQFALFFTNTAIVSGVEGINFGTATNVSGAFSIEAWVYSASAQGVGGAGIVCLGYGAGGEQFALDCGGNAPNGFRFYFRDALTGASHNAQGANPTTGTNGTGDALWHHLVGVLDETHSNQFLYIDGLPVAHNILPGNLGVLNVQSPTNPFSIGARNPGTTPNNFADQFSGDIDEVAIYNYPLSAAQVQAHYFASGITPVMLRQPTNTTVSEGTTATFTGLAYGSPTLQYQWWNSDGSNLTTPLAGQTGTNLVFNNASAGPVNYYQLVVTNTYGGVTSAPASLTVVSGPPQILTDINSTYIQYADTPVTLNVSVAGTPPFTYGWSYNGAPLANGSRVSGVNTPNLTINPAQVVDSGTYQLFITNGQGTAQSTLATVTIIPSLTFNGSGTGWSANNNGAGANGFVVGTNALQLTDGGGSEASSAFFSSPLYIAGFKATFTYQDVNLGGADGVTFCLQNDPRGAAALGTAGGGLGYGFSGNAGGVITPSVAFEMSLYTGTVPGGGPGIGLGTNGNTGSAPGTIVYTVPGSIVLGSGDPITVSLSYLAGIVSLTMTDAVASTSYSATLPVNIPSLVGANTAYVGFTGADGGVSSQQIITNFSFVSLAPLTISGSGGTVNLTWPLGTGGYQVQANSALNNPGGWVTLPYYSTNWMGNNQITLPITTSPTYYRLVNP